MRSSVKQAITDEKDSHDVFLWAFILGIGGVVVLTAVSIYQGHTPSLRDFSESFAWLLGGGGGGYSIKRIGEKYGSTDNSRLPQE